MLSDTKKLLRDMCRTTGHESSNKFNRCPRCQKKLPFSFRVWEKTGMTIYNPGGVAKFKFKNEDGN